MPRFSTSVPVALTISILLLLVVTNVTISEVGPTGQTIYLPIVAQDHDPTWQWQPPTEVVLMPPPFGQVTSAIDRQGRLHLFWDVLQTPRFVYHSYYDGSNWSAAVPVAESLGTSTILYPPLIDDAGNLHLLWRNHLGLGIEKPYRLIYARFDGLQWQPEEEVYRTGNSNVKGMFHPNGQDDIAIAMLESALSTTAYQLTRGLGGWQLSEAIVPGHLTHWAWPDRHMGIHFYGSDLNDNMYYSYWRNGAFQIAGRQLEGNVFTRDTQLDGQNNLHSFWRSTVPIPGGSVNGLHYRCLRSNLTWTAPRVLSGENNVGSTRLKAADTDKRFALLWYENEESAHRLGLWDGCTQTDHKPVPLSSDKSWSLMTLSLSHNPNQVCVVARQSFVQAYTAVCATMTR
jgi:hypothetical protein